MRYLVTPNFSKKIADQSNDTIALISAFIKKIEASDKNDILTQGIDGVFPQLITSDILVFKFKAQNLKIYATFGRYSEGDYLLLLDFTIQRKAPSSYKALSFKNPRTNNLYNPRLNSTINPHLNSTINPRLNSTINPHLNSTINPRLNSMINYRLNSTINPRLNSAINPRLNAAFSGPFIYSQDLNQEGFIVRANADVELIFDNILEFKGLAIRANKNVSVLFNEDNDWIGHLVSANEEVRLRYDQNNDWIGIIID